MDNLLVFTEVQKLMNLLVEADDLGELMILIDALFLIMKQLKALKKL